MRRTLDFFDFDAVLADVERLRRDGYRRAGTWDLPQACDHLTRFMRGSLEGFGFQFPLPFRLAGRWLFLGRTLRTRRIPTGVKGPAPLMPPADVGGDAAVRAFAETVARVRDHRGDFHPSPLFGRLTPEQWRQIHLIHAAHHLSFLVPNDPAAA
jgi:hypothetical protein